MNTTKTFISEDDLVFGLKNRDNEAYKVFHDTYASSTYGYILRRISEDDTGQLYEDIFTIILKTIDYYDSSKSTFFTWMMNIIRRHVAIVASNKSFNVSRILSNNASVSVDMQIVFLLIYYQSFKPDEVAEATGIPAIDVADLFRTAVVHLIFLK